MLKLRKGFTLIELMVAIAILAVLAAIAIPIYTRYSERTYRSEAMADLMECAQALERRASVTFDYLGAAVGGADAGAIDPSVCTPKSTAANRYVINVNGTAAGFTLTAVPQNNTDQNRQLSYDSNGRRGWDENGDGAIADPAEMDWEES
ncbi:MAG: type IV pilin protein [Pseudomonadales bacterium]|jgi:type IV pilus assembly protein PilE